MLEEVTGRVDELRYFLRTQDLRERATAFGSRNVFEQIASLQRLDIEEAERRYMLLHGAGIQLLLLKQVGLILAQVLRTEPVRCPNEGETDIEIRQVFEPEEFASAFSEEEIQQEKNFRARMAANAAKK